MQSFPSQRVLLTLFIASLVSTSLHYIDNYRFISAYPQPSWITPPSIYIAWIMLTIVGIAGIWLYYRANYYLAYGCLLIYSLTGLTSLAHYFYGAMSMFSPKMHLFIWTDGLTGAAIASFVLWSGLVLKEQQGGGQRV